jgi:hypothetical protein
MSNTEQAGLCKLKGIIYVSDAINGLRTWLKEEKKGQTVNTLKIWQNKYYF